MGCGELEQGVHPFIGNKEMILPIHVNTPVLVFIPRCFPNFQGKVFTCEAPGVFLTGILLLMGWFPHLLQEISTFQAVLWGF